MRRIDVVTLIETDKERERERERERGRERSSTIILVYIEGSLCTTS